jgi:hypothetical protein
MTLDQAQALHPGDHVWSCSTMAPVRHTIEWEVYTPDDNLYAGVKGIVQFLRQPGSRRFSRSLITLDWLPFFYLSDPLKD